MYVFRDTYFNDELSYETNNEPSMTQPDMTMSIYEILTRHSQNRPIPNEMIHEPQYSGSMLHPLSRKGLDLADIPSIKEEVAKEINNAKSLLSQLKDSEVDELSQIKSSLSDLASRIDGLSPKIE